MARNRKYDWDSIREQFITSECSLESLSSDTTGNSSDPSYAALRHYSRRERWTQLREEHRRNRITAAAANPTVQAVAETTEEIINASEIILKHLRIAKLLQSVGVGRIKIANAEEISYKDALASIELAASLEQTILKIEDIATALEVVIRAGYIVTDPTDSSESIAQVLARN